jgi:hypothetical protein
MLEELMATSEEKQDLVDTIKRPIRHYRIRLWGYGGEVSYGKSSKEEFAYWETDIEARRAEFNIPDDESPFNRYMMDKDDIGGYETVPSTILREGEWYDQADVDHGYGVAYESANIDIVEVEDDEYNAEEIDTVHQGVLDEFIDQYDASVVVGESEAVEQEYCFYAMDIQKGTFFDGILTVNGKIDLSKLKFECTEYPNGDTLVNHVFYEQDEIDNSAGADTNSKALYIELHKL